MKYNILTVRNPAQKKLNIFMFQFRSFERSELQVHEPGELFWKKKNLFFYLQKTDEKLGQNFRKKNSNTCHLQKKKIPPGSLL